MIPKRKVQNSDSLRNAQGGFNSVRQAQSAVMRISSRILRDPVTGGATHSDGRKQGGSRVSRPFRSI